MTAEMWSYFKGVPVIKLYLSSDDKQNIPITITLSNNNSNNNGSSNGYDNRTGHRKCRDVANVFIESCRIHFF